MEDQWTAEITDMSGRITGLLFIIEVVEIVVIVVTGTLGWGRLAQLLHLALPLEAFPSPLFALTSEAFSSTPETVDFALAHRCRLDLARTRAPLIVKVSCSTLGTSLLRRWSIHAGRELDITAPPSAFGCCYKV